MFKLKVEKNSNEHMLILEMYLLLILTENEILLSQGGATEELFEAITNMVQEKSPWNNRLTKEFHKNFWEDLKYILTTFIRATKRKKKFISSEKPTAIKLGWQLNHFFDQIGW